MESRMSESWSGASRRSKAAAPRYGSTSKGSSRRSVSAAGFNRGTPPSRRLAGRRLAAWAGVTPADQPAKTPAFHLAQRRDGVVDHRVESLAIALVHLLDHQRIPIESAVDGQDAVEVIDLVLEQLRRGLIELVPGLGFPLLIHIL